MFAARAREPTGISLQEMGAQAKTSLLESSQEENLQRRIVFRDGVLHEYTHLGQQTPNSIRNQKYSIITFIPLVLYQQFRYFFNLFYLLTAISQFVPVLKVGLLFSFLSPLLLVLALTMAKEGYEDYNRYKRDDEINSAQFKKIDSNGEIFIKAEEIRVGDLLVVVAGDQVPADCVLLASMDQKSSIFIKTDQLDGETDWKARKPATDQVPANFTVEINPPVPGIYNFSGTLTLEDSERVDLGSRVGVGLEQTLWRGVKVAVGKILLLVIYTGRQTKLSLNCKQSGSKFGLLDSQLNYFSKILFLIMLSLSLLLVFLRGSYSSFPQALIFLFKYFLLLSYIIPISMRVNLDFAKLVYKYQIEHDPYLQGCQCRNSNIPEELGRITYVLSDKTGTLTQNQMIFRKLMLGDGCCFDQEDQPRMKNILTSQGEGQEERETKRKVEETVVALSLCHNVTPVVDNGVRRLQGSSPDELTLVQFAQSLGFVLTDRSKDCIAVSSPRGEKQYTLEQVFPFSSQTKNMGIILRSKAQNEITYYLKGADTVMKSKLAHFDSNYMNEASSDLAAEGLRILVIAKKRLTQEEFQGWRREFNEAQCSLKDRAAKIQLSRDSIEQGMQFLGVTGVQDKLQKGVVETVASLRSIGVKLWMLTGDKIETAICVARAVKLIHGRSQKVFIIQEATTVQHFHHQLDSLYSAFKLDRHNLPEQINLVLVIDGTSLGFALESSAKEFFDLAVRMPAIVCSRVSPTQKAEVALLVRQWGEGRVLGIGDGGNDVALIQSSHVGVGIYGKEGIQAALASDFSISQFSDLNGLIYWHGRLSYKRSSLLSQFIIHRGTIITIMQTIFCIEYFFVALPIYNGFLLLGYSTIFTMLPVFSLILDQDVTRKMALDYPILYKRSQSGSELTLQSFIYWLLISVYQGTVIMILMEIMLGVQSFYLISTISFTCLVLIQFLNILTELHRIRMVQMGSIAISLLIYLLLIFLMKNVLNGIELFSTSYLPATFLIVVTAWGPPFLVQMVKKWIDPSEEQKLMKNREILAGTKMESQSSAQIL